jgi:D-alanyl-D-alanine dipeptidase
VSLLWALLLAGAPALEEVPPRLPGVVVELRYGTPSNFTGHALYPPGARCLLLPRTLEVLARAVSELERQGHRLKLYDCYRPQSVQVALWHAEPRPGYVMDPRKGSTHSRGAAVDVTLVDPSGRELAMPSPYDFFGAAAHHGFRGGPARARANRETLRRAMVEAGFKPNPYEWWHYELPDAFAEPVRDEPLVR